MLSKILDVYLHSEKIGELSQDQYGSLHFSYQDSASWPLSLSLPINKKVFSQTQCRPYFAGLLPDDHIREKLAKVFHISAKNDYALLSEIGGECAGAVTLLPHGEKLTAVISGKQRLVSQDELIKMIGQLSQAPILSGQHIRLSLAGAQNKLALCYDGKNYSLPNLGPSTHIIKPALSAYPDSAHNEAFCMRLASLVGLPVAHCQLQTLENISYILVARYDREQQADGTIQRIHQEDMCQAMAIVPEHRYQNEGGPSLQQCFALVTQHSQRPVIDRKLLLDGVIYNFLIGNHDAHGKNFSILHADQGIRLAPFYDLLSTAVYPEISLKMSMKIGRHYKPDRVLLRHWEQLAANTQISPAWMQERLQYLAEQVLEKAEKLVCEMTAEGFASSVYQRIIDVITQRKQQIANYFRNTA
jgi:serine/threonine-protein kinase HipA